MGKDVRNRDLLERHRQEREFHDRIIYMDERQDFYNVGATHHVFQRLLEYAGDLQGKRVLDLGCGNGWSAAAYAKRGAIVAGVDISAESVRMAKASLEKQTVGNHLSLQVMAAEQLGYVSECFDYVFGVALLHHTDLSKSLPEVGRVLRPGGRAIFIEPLIHNPIIQAYRRLTPQSRSPMERPLSLADIDQMQKVFSRVTYEGFYLFSIAAFFWNKVIRCNRCFLWWQETLMKMDEFALRCLPRLRKYCWVTLLLLEK